MIQRDDPPTSQTYFCKYCDGTAAQQLIVRCLKKMTSFYVCTCSLKTEPVDPDSYPLDLSNSHRQHCGKVCKLTPAVRQVPATNTVVDCVEKSKIVADTVRRFQHFRAQIWLNSVMQLIKLDSGQDTCLHHTAESLIAQSNLSNRNVGRLKL